MHFKCRFDTRPPTSSQVCPRLARCRPPDGKKKSDGRESPKLAKRPHDKSEPGDNRDLRPTLQPQAAIRTCRSPPQPDRDRTSRPLSSNQGARTRAACRGRGLSQRPLHVNSLSQWSSAKSRPPSPRISVRKRRSAYRPVTRRVAQQTGRRWRPLPS